MMRTSYAFAHPRGKAGIAHLHFAGDAHHWGIIAFTLPSLIYSKS